MIECIEKEKIAIALSGGGARAMAFHLGCLKALHETGILSKSSVLSCVSGGSVLGAMYVTHVGTFEEFEAKVRHTLEQGFAKSMIRATLTTPEGLKALLSAIILNGYRILRALSASVSWVSQKVIRHPEVRTKTHFEVFTPRRFASRTTILEKAFDLQLFQGKSLKQISKTKLKYVSVATELRTGAAFYFTPGESGCWRYGKVNPDDISVARAVTASAAYPLFLPALDEIFDFERREGETKGQRVTLSDGGIYDNLGLAPLWPDRTSEISVEIPKPSIIIACRAGYGLRFGQPTNSLPTRLYASFITTFDRSQNAALKRLFDLKKSGDLKAIVLPYLGQLDERLTHAPRDLVKREEVSGYPTDFRAMKPDWIERLVKRGEQLTLAVLKQHNPELLG